MIAINQRAPEQPGRGDWQTEFLVMLPQIEARLRRAFAHWTPEAQEEAIQAGVAYCVQAYVRLHGQGRADNANPGALALFAARQFRAGRAVGMRANVHEPLSRYAQLRKQIKLETLDRRCAATGVWLEEFVEDRRASIPDCVAMRIDVPAWFRGLSRRMQRIARDLAIGRTTSEVAKKYRLTAGRISQVRRELHISWQRFHEAGSAAA